MGEPLLGIKWFCLWVCLFVVLTIICKFMAASRAVDHRFIMSNLEWVMIILRFATVVFAVLSLLWSAVAWIIT